MYFLSLGYKAGFTNRQTAHITTGKAIIKPARNESLSLTKKASVTPVTIKLSFSAFRGEIIMDKICSLK